LQAATGHATDQFLHEDSDRQRVIAERRPRSPPRSLFREPLRCCCGPDEFGDGERTVDGGEAGLVREQLPYGHRFFAAGRELRPVVDDGTVEDQPTVVEECGDHHRRDTLRHREDAGHGPAFQIRSTREIDDPATSLIDAQLRAERRILGEIRIEHLPYAGETVVGFAVCVKAGVRHL
jgi:hypothetical protein